MQNQPETTGMVRTGRWSLRARLAELRVRLLLLVLLVLLPALLLLLYTASEQERLAITSAQREALRVAQLVGSNQDQIILGTKQLLQALSQLQVMRDGDSEGCNRLFEDLQKQYPNYTNFWVTDANGDTYCTGIPSSQNFNVKNAPWFQRAIQSKDFSVGDYGIGIATGKPLVTFAYPIFDDNHNVRLLVATGLSLNWVNSFIQDTQLPPATTMTAIDRNGVILFRFPDKQDWVGKQYPIRSTVDTIMAQGTGTVTAPGISGTERLIGFSPLGHTNGSAYIMISASRDVAYSEANRLLAQNLAGMGAVGVFTLLLAWFAANSLVVRPIHNLVDGTTSLTKGELGTRIESGRFSGTSELRQLSNAFNTMAATLEQRQDELLAARNDLEFRVQQRTAELEAANLRLKDEVIEREQAEQQVHLAASRTVRLQEVTAALSGAITPAEVAQVYVQQAMAAMGADAGAMSLKIDDTTLAPIYAYGYPDDVVKRWSRFSVDEEFPMSEAVRLGQPIWIESREERTAHYPNIADKDEGRNSWAAVPLIVKGRTVGSAAFGFATQRHFSDDDKALMVALARQCAQALERADLYEESQKARAEAEKARHQLAFLAEASTLLATSLYYETTLANLGKLIIPAIADTYTADVVDENGTPRRVALAAAEPVVENAIREVTRRYGIDPSGRSIRQVLNTGEPLLLSVMPDTTYTATAQDSEHLALLRVVGTRSAIVVPLRVRDQVIGVLSIGITQSDRTYTDDDLTLALELARRAAQALDNARLYSQAKEAIRLRDEFLSVAAHELKTPVTSMRGFAQTLLRRLDKPEAPDPDQIRHSLQIIDQQSHKLSKLLAQLLDISRLEAGRLTLEIQPTDLTALVEDVTTMMQRTTERHQITVEQAAKLEAQIDPYRIEQVLVNLLDNAIKYSPDGGTIQVVVSAPLESDSGRGRIVQITITDHGIGIPAERRAQIFDRFYQAHQDGYLGGMGLGLYISQQIVELHGGKIQAAFPDEGGTRFVVQLPLRVTDKVPDSALKA